MEYIERLIAKYLSGTLSEEEAGVLRRWVGQSPEREARLRSLQERNDFVLKYRRYAAVDSENAKHRFVRSVRRRIGWVTPRRVIYYAAVVLPFVALSIWFAQKEEPEVPGFTLSEVTPGATQAILLMDNGTELALTGQGERTIALDDSLSAQMEDGAITYSSSVASKSKVESHTIVVPRGGEYRITLSDGTRVHINADSKLRFPVAFTGHERVVQLSGEAFFEVAPSSECPFIVEVGTTRVRQYGTTFNINAYGANPEVVLVTGSIGVTPEGGEEVALVPGQLAVCGEQIAVSDIDVRPYIEWTQGRFTFDNERLADIVPDLVRWYDVEIAILDETVADMRFTGSVGRDETIEHIMNAISYTQDVRVTVKGNKIEISK